MKRKINPAIGVWVIVVIAIIFPSCSKKDDKKVGLLLHEMEGRWYSDVKYLQKYAGEAGLELIVKVADGDENKQLIQTKELIREGVSTILVVAVNQNTAAGIVRLAQNAGVKTIAYDRIIQNAYLDYLLTYDYSEIGRMQAEYAYKKVPRGNYVILWGDASDNNARQMQKSQEEYFQKYVENGDIHIVYKSFIDNWSDDNAMHTMQKILDFSNQKIDVVLASNDNIAMAVLEAYKKSNIPLPSVITGQDATEKACRSIADNNLTMTISKPTDEMADKAIKLINEMQGKKIIKEVSGTVNNMRKDVPAIFLTGYVVDKVNIGKLLN